MNTMAEADMAIYRGIKTIERNAEKTLLSLLNRAASNRPPAIVITISQNV
jgi:hypothetical protein